MRAAVNASLFCGFGDLAGHRISLQESRFFKAWNSVLACHRTTVPGCHAILCYACMGGKRPSACLRRGLCGPAQVRTRYLNCGLTAVASAKICVLPNALRRWRQRWCNVLRQVGTISWRSHRFLPRTLCAPASLVGWPVPQRCRNTSPRTGTCSICRAES